MFMAAVCLMAAVTRSLRDLSKRSYGVGGRDTDPLLGPGPSWFVLQFISNKTALEQQTRPRQSWFVLPLNPRNTS